MQNSDDAKSSNIQIIFETKNNKVVRIRFKNDGFAFRLEDWNRLKKIAEGNPDEQKIGAFGVGFYSLFKICENPFVFSGGRGMAFYWRGNQLFTKQGQQKSNDDWTTFLMDMKGPIEVPNVEEFARFLANSLGFTENLQKVHVYFDEILVIQLSKKIQELKSIEINPEFNTFSSQNMFHLTSVKVGHVQLDVERLIIPTNFSIEYLRSNNYQTEKASIFLKIANGSLDVKVNDKFSLKMEQTTKKKPPSRTNIQMIFTGFNEHNLSSDYNKSTSSVFKDLLQYPEQGKIYIGFSTNQTTGCCSHLAARVIPTMERVSIDMADETLAKYNSEILCLAGTLCRILYEDEMDQIKQLYDERDRALFEKRAAYALSHFTFHSSTPNEIIGKIIESQFFDCSKQSISILSTNGVRSIADIRIPNLEMMGFIKNVPVVPDILLEQCNTFFKKAKNSLNLISELNFQDVLNELNSRVFSDDEIIELLKWWISYQSNGSSVNSIEYAQFMQLARINYDNDLRPLNTFYHFLNPGIVPPDMDVPSYVFPYTILKKLKEQTLKIQEFNDHKLQKWFGWTELSITDWAKFIINKSDLVDSPLFAEKIHEILARNLKRMPQYDKGLIIQLFTQKRCIPTKLGMKFPDEAYFQNVNIFPELPTIKFQNPSLVKNVMELLGVRKVVELNLIFNRLNQGNWDHMQLLKYFASISSDLKKDEIRILKTKPIWPKENLADSQPTSKIQRFITSDLHVPSPLYREFGLPIIDWKGKWSSSTQEGKFLIELGLREHPTLKKILELA
ncbi:hypothetical protein GLOIN_2v1834043 [Rhizophagus clarus]|uniref:Uncharacterized protein n=1 Tax=Rhizophagus clarus TaxID=94130 RepID=A0A8H3KWN5_9GLOM|nr:hypothetical protein GLOIN_2v1834043 [Rhizophagus clarus]